jgi:hypothetical protein
MGRIDVYPSGSGAIPFTGQTLGYAEVNTNQGSITTEVDLTGLFVTVTVPAGRRIRITAQGPFISTVDQDEIRLNVKEGSTVLNIAQLMVSGASKGGTAICEAVISPSAGTHTYKLSALRQSGSGSITSAASATFPAFIHVEDVTGYTTNTPALSVPVGVLAQAVLTSNQGPFGAGPTDIAGTSLNITVPAGRVLKLSANAQFGGYSDAITAHYVRVFEDGVAIGNISLWPRMPTTDFTSMEGSVLRSPTAGTHTYKLVVTRYANTGTVNLSANAAEPGFFFIEDITPTPAPGNGAPSSTLGYSQRTTNIAITGSNTDLGIPVTVTVPAGRRIRVSGFTEVANTQAGINWAVGRILEGATQLQEDIVPLGATGGNNQYGSVAPSIILTPSAGTHTYTMVAAVQTTGGTALAAANAPAYLLVEDITGAVWPAGSSVSQTRILRFVLDGGGVAITTGAKKAYMSIPYTCTITKARLMADQSGSIVVDLWKTSFGGFPPTVANTITASNKPTLSSAQTSENTTLTGWTTGLTVGDVLELNVDSATTVTKVYLDLFVTGVLI